MLKDDIELFVKQVIIQNINNVGLIEGGRLQYLLNNLLSKIYKIKFYPIEIDKLGNIVIAFSFHEDGFIHHICLNVKDVITQYEERL